MVILTEEESISLILFCSKNNSIFGKMKLNKLLARLNLFLIPCDIEFSLNKFGSYNANLEELQTNEYFEITINKSYGKDIPVYFIKEEGQKLVAEIVIPKLLEIYEKKEISLIKEKIFNLSLLDAQDISSDEHKKLLVDIDDKFKLKQKINEILIELTDFYLEIDKIPENSIFDIKLSAMIEYSYFLIKYLERKMTSKLDDESKFDFDSYMFDYYFIYILYDEVLPFIKREFKSHDNNEKLLTRIYGFLTESVKYKYPFSLHNENLKDLLVA